MGTRSTIIVRIADDKWASIYCHWDGYLEHNGRILFDNYTSQKRCTALVKLGDLSVLGPEIGEKHPFEWQSDLYNEFRNKYPNDYEKQDAAMYRSTRYKKWNTMCLAYGRDRGQKDTKADIHTSLQAAWPENGTSYEFVYVWIKDRWYVADPDEGSQTLIDLGDALTGKKTLCPKVKMIGGVVLGKHHPVNVKDGHSWSRAKAR
jgi:hypothetical protein